MTRAEVLQSKLFLTLFNQPNSVQAERCATWAAGGAQPFEGYTVKAIDFNGSDEVDFDSTDIIIGAVANAVPDPLNPDDVSQIVYYLELNIS